MSSSQPSITNGNNSPTIQNNDDNLKYNCVAIRQEIQRFESVHPSIYAIYDLLELNSDQVLSIRIREHLLSIEDSFVNSQEWTLSRSVPDLRLGIVGDLNSGKSALVHRYLTGSYMQDESPEGGRFKKEVFIPGHRQSNMLLIRDEGGPPEKQFACWVDAVIFVFNVDNLESFECIKEYYQKLASNRPNLDQVPLILVGTQDNESTCNHLIDEYTARHLAEEMQHDCAYFETCATYGHNVDKVFLEACQRIIQKRSQFDFNSASPVNNLTPSYSNQQTGYLPSYLSRPSTPNTANQQTQLNNYMINNNYYNGQSTKQPSPLSTFNYQSPLSNQQQQNSSLNNSLRKSLNTPINKNLTTSAYGNLSNSLNITSAKEQHIFISPTNPISQSAKKLENKNLQLNNNTPLAPTSNLSSTVFTPISTIKEALQKNAPKNNPNQLPISAVVGSGPSLIKHQTPVLTQNNSNKTSSNNPETPTCTPSTNRKARRRSNLFSVSSSKNKNLEEKSKNGELGSGRTIPLRQGYLHKKSVNSSLGLNTKLSIKNKEWKKKYVTLTTDGCLTYHSSLHDYMNDTHGKKISLMHTTVKIPGQKPRGSSIITNTPVSIHHQTTTIDGDLRGLNLLSSNQNNNNNNQINCQPIVNESCIDVGNLLNDKCMNCGSVFNNLDDRRLITNSSVKEGKDSSKKKHHRHKSNQLPVANTTNAYCERCANLIENSNGFTFVSNNGKADSMNGNHEEDDFVFVIVSLDNKQWHFQAQSSEDREGWLQAIENQILLSLQNIQSDKDKLGNNNSEQSNNEKIFKDQIKQISGNNYCLDCDATNPTWASLNLGGLICIECSGIHRNLGTHISKVRSLDLDNWPQDNISVMLALGNSAVNKIWEYDTKNLSKPVPTSSRDEKEAWIRRKYERKEFMCPLSNQLNVSNQLENSIRNQDIRKVFQILSQLNSNQTSLNELRFNGNQRSTALQLAVSTNNIAIVQLLIWNSNSINLLDGQGQNVLAYAKSKEMQDLLNKQNGLESSINSPLARSTNESIINKVYQPNQTDQNTNFSFRDKSRLKATQMSNLVTSDFDQLPTSII